MYTMKYSISAFKMAKHKMKARGKKGNTEIVRIKPTWFYRFFSLGLILFKWPFSSTQDYGYVFKFECETRFFF